MFMPAPLSPILVYLGWSAILLIVQVLIQSQLATMEQGIGYGMSPRDDDRKVEGKVAGRAQRALRNLLETYPAFVALALALALTGKTSGWALTGTAIWFWARVAHLPLYLAGIPVVRTLAWLVSVIGLVVMALALLAGL